MKISKLIYVIALISSSVLSIEVSIQSNASSELNTESA